ncbi:hypothetical protein ABFV59_27170 [Pseudomonas silesiensis]|jgi:hypothetical protein
MDMNTPVTSRYSATPTVILEADKPAGEQPMELFITDEYGIALSLFVYQGQKFVETLSELLIKDEMSRSDRFAVFESFVGMLAAGFAAVQGLSVTILQGHIEQMDSAAGKLNTMSRLGRWAGIAGDAAFGFGAFAATIDSGKHSLQWGKALAEGNYQGLAATTLQIAGDGILVGTCIWGAKHTTSIIRQILKKPAELRALAWAEASPRLQSICVKATGPRSSNRRILALL